MIDKVISKEVENKTVERKESEDFKPFYWFIGIVGILWIMTLVSFKIGKYYPLIMVPGNTPGEFGDMFGGLNALFTGLAFAGLTQTILLQRKDLKLQREVLEIQLNELKLQRQELELTRKTLEGQRAEMKEQNVTLNIQRLENTFFALLKQFNNLIEIMILNDRTGRGVFLIPAISLNNSLSKLTLDLNINKFLHLIKSRDDMFGPYFRSFFTLVEFINRAEISPEEKYFYISTFKNQLTTNELECIMVYGFQEEFQYPYKSKRLIEKYSLLTHVDNEGKLYNLIKDNYEECAFYHLLKT